MQITSLQQNNHTSYAHWKGIFNMLDRNTFMETLRGVAEIVRTSAEPLTKEEILDYFKDMELSEEQQNMVFEYLSTPHEDETPNEEPEDNPDVTSRQDKEERSCSKALELYMEDLKGIREYTEDELENMYEELLNGNSGLINQISDSMLANVAVLADEYASEKVALEDLIQEGNIALFVRLGELCGIGADSGYDVVAEAGEAVNDAMKAYVSQITGEEDSENAVVGKANLVKEAIKHLKDADGAEPSVKELAEYTHLSEDELSDILNIIKDLGN